MILGKPPRQQSSFAAADGHQAEMQGQPGWDGEEDDRAQAIPGPKQGVRLHGIDRDHEIVGEAGVAQKAAIFRKTFADAAVKRDQAQNNDKRSNQQIDWAHACPFRDVIGPAHGVGIGVKPVGARPDKTETGLEGRAKIRLGGSGFVEEQSKVKRHDSPNELDMLKGCHEQIDKDRPFMVHASRGI